MADEIDRSRRDRSWIRVEVFVRGDDGAARLAASIEAPQSDILYGDGVGTLQHGSRAQDAIHAALDQRYHSIMSGSFSLVVDGVCLNNCRINRVSADSRFTYDQQGQYD